MKLYELTSKNPIDRELEKTSNDIKTDGSLDPDDIAAQGEPPEGQENVPDVPMSDMGGMEPPEEPSGPDKPVDSALMSRLQGHNYIQNYVHDKPSANTNPAMIMDMDMPALSNLANQIQIKIDQQTLARKTNPSDPTIIAAYDMQSFVNDVMMYKKAAAKTKATSTGGKPKVRNQKQSKVKSGQKFKHKQS